MASPTQLTLKELKRRGCLCDVAEKWNPFANVRTDLFGWIDIVYLSPEGIVGVQCTSASNHAKRRRKIVGEASEQTRQWINAGGIVEIWSWKKVKNAGRRMWTPRIERIERAQVM